MQSKPFRENSNDNSRTLQEAARKAFLNCLEYISYQKNNMEQALALAEISVPPRVKALVPLKEKKHRTLTILMMGLKGAGKTTLIHRLQNKPIHTITQSREISEAIIRGTDEVFFTEIGFPVDDNHVLHDDRWSTSVAEYQGLIWVVDSHDRTNFRASGAYLKAAMERLTVAERIPILVLANKNDLEGAADRDLNEVHVGLKLDDQFYQSRMLRIEGCSAITGEGRFEEALDWLISYM